MEFGQLNMGQAFIVVTETDPERKHIPRPVFVKINPTEITTGKVPRQYNALYLNAFGSIWLPEEMEVLPIAFPNGNVIVDIKSYNEKRLLELHGIISKAFS